MASICVPKDIAAAINTFLDMDLLTSFYWRLVCRSCAALPSLRTLVTKKIDAWQAYWNARIYHVLVSWSTTWEELVFAVDRGVVVELFAAHCTTVVRSIAFRSPWDYTCLISYAHSPANASQVYNRQHIYNHYWKKSYFDTACYYYNRIPRSSATLPPRPEGIPPLQVSVSNG